MTTEDHVFHAIIDLTDRRLGPVRIASTALVYRTNKLAAEEAAKTGATFTEATKEDVTWAVSRLQRQGKIGMMDNGAGASYWLTTPYAEQPRVLARKKRKHEFRKRKRVGEGTGQYQTQTGDER